jgi:hypothetical protein
MLKTAMAMQLRIYGGKAVGARAKVAAKAR